MNLNRILFISKPYVCRSYREKMKILARTGKFQVGLICPPSWGTQVFEPPDDAETNAIWIRVLPIGFPNKNHFHYYKDLANNIDIFAPDLIVVEEEDYSFVTFQVFRIAQKRRIKTMFYAWQNIEKHYPPPFSWFQQYIYKRAVGAMGGSERAKEIVRRKGFQGPFEVIPQVGTDLSAFALDGTQPAPKDVTQPHRKWHYKNALGISAETFVLYFAGRVVKEKGVQTVIQALKNFQNKDILFLCLGSGPYLETLRQQASDLGVAPLVRFVDAVPHAQISSYAKAADALCLGSLTLKNWKEQGPVRVVTESLAAGAVPIVSDSGELPDVVDGCGLVFAEGNSQQLTERICSLMESPELRSRLLANGKIKLEERYSAQAVAKCCDEFFTRILT